MEQFIIQGGIPLKGEVSASGNKNAALPLMAACLLTDEPIILKNVPNIKDIHAMRCLLESLGVKHGTWEEMRPHAGYKMRDIRKALTKTKKFNLPQRKTLRMPNIGR